MQKTLTKEQYCYANNLDPKLFESVEEAAKWLNWQDKMKAHNAKNIRIEVKNLDK